MSFSVIIPSKTASNLIPCVEAVRKCEPEARIIVVDDFAHAEFSADGSDVDLYNLRTIEALNWPCEIVRGIKPFIFARNVNLGIRKALEDPDCAGVVACNDDALLETQGGFSVLAKAAADHPEYGVIGAVTNVTGQRLQQPKGIGLREVPSIAFVCVYIPRRTIDHLAELGKKDPRFGDGLLDEIYCIDYGVEDLAYCYAVKQAGLKVGVHDGCYVDHGSLRSSFRGDPKAPKGYQKNYALFKAKWGVNG